MIVTPWQTQLYHTLIARKGPSVRFGGKYPMTLISGFIVLNWINLVTRAENGFKFTNVMNNMFQVKHKKRLKQRYLYRFFLFQISDFMNMPDDINFILDELGEARNDAKENEVTCQEMYNQCPSKTIMDIVNRAKKLVMR